MRLLLQRLAGSHSDRLSADYLAYGHGGLLSTDGENSDNYQGIAMRIPRRALSESQQNRLGAAIRDI